jgi:hypothetical protein
MAARSRHFSAPRGIIPGARERRQGRKGRARGARGEACGEDGGRGAGAGDASGPPERSRADTGAAAAARSRARFVGAEHGHRHEGHQQGRGGPRARVDRVHPGGDPDGPHGEHAAAHQVAAGGGGGDEAGGGCRCAGQDAPAVVGHVPGPAPGGRCGPRRQHREADPAGHRPAVGDVAQRPRHAAARRPRAARRAPPSSCRGPPRCRRRRSPSRRRGARGRCG